MDAVTDERVADLLGAVDHLAEARNLLGRYDADRAAHIQDLIDLVVSDAEPDVHPIRIR